MIRFKISRTDDSDTMLRVVVIDPESKKEVSQAIQVQKGNTVDFVVDEDHEVVVSEIF